jgi:serine/threonine-protein kinase RsbW
MRIMRRVQPRRILVALPKSEPLANDIVSHFSRSGWKVDIFSSIEGCQKALKEGGARLCIIDHSLPGAQRFMRSIKSKKGTSLIPVILLFAQETQVQRADELRICGEQHIAYPAEPCTLIVLAEREITRSAGESAFTQQVYIQLPTTEDNLDRASVFMSELLKESGLTEEKQVAISAALREAVINAAQHGNRYNKDKQIKIQYLLDRQKVTLVVCDEGDGFNPQIYFQRSEISDAVTVARERYEEGGLGGLGIMLMVRCSDRVEYNQKGNLITLTKFL